MGSSISWNGVGFCELLTLIFVTLKLTGYIEWSWWWVLAPIWIPILIFVIYIAIWAFGYWRDWWGP